MSAPDRTAFSLSPIATDQIEKVHLATLEILQRTGVAVQEPEARRLLLDAGAHAGAGDRLRIPPDLVKRALATAPERIVMHSTDARPVMPLEPGRVFFGTGSDTPNTFDPRTRKRRPATLQDVRDIARFTDALANIDFIMSMAVPCDVPKSTTFVHEFAAMVASSRKPIIFTAYDNRDMETIYAIATTVAGSEDALRQKPFLMLYSEPIAPLQHTKIGVEKMLFCAERSIPVAYIPGIMSAGNAPATLAGALAQGNAECLSGLVIHQLKRPGAPFLYGLNVTVMDLRTTVLSYAAPEFAMTNSIAAAMARHYRLPVWGLAGASDSKTPDAQAGAEAAFSILTAALSGGNLVHDVGYLESGLTSSMEMILLGDEMISMTRRLLRGIDLDDASFALETIDGVGPGGAFIDLDHTRQTFRAEHWIPRFLDRRRHDAWRNDGSPALADRLNAEVRRILKTHQPAPLPVDKAEEIAKIISAREAADARRKS